MNVLDGGGGWRIDGCGGQAGQAARWYFVQLGRQWLVGDRVFGATTFFTAAASLKMGSKQNWASSLSQSSTLLPGVELEIARLV
mgnify:CR=1 FL=1